MVTRQSGEAGVMDHAYAIHVLKLPPTYTLEQLRTNYKRMALLLHPDRRTLDSESANHLFSILTDSYKLLKAELDGGSSSSHDADWMTMRSAAVGTPVGPTPSDPKHGGGCCFNIDGFNTRFSESRLGDENDRGYSSWMQRLTPDAAAGQQKRRQQEDRQKAADTNARALVVQEPEALPSSTTVPHSELGTGRVRDFGRQADVVGRLGYTDYKVAHMTASCLIDPEVVRTRQHFNNMEEYERARSESAANAITVEEAAAIARSDALSATREDRRLKALQVRDDLVSRHHARIHAGVLT